MFSSYQSTDMLFIGMFPNDEDVMIAFQYDVPHFGMQ